MRFRDLVKDLLVDEYDKTEDEANFLIDKQPNIVMAAIQRAETVEGLMDLIRPTALALCLFESEEKEIRGNHGQLRR